MYLGIDVGTSGVKAALIDDDDAAIGQATAPLTVQRPAPLHAEQAPEDWWQATCTALDRLAAAHATAMAKVRAIGLSGQMLGVTLVDADGKALRPALLWNDGRATAEGSELLARFRDFATITGAQPMPGFSAPKLLWLARHEPERLSRARRILLPKDYVRLHLTGEAVTDLADGSATLLMATAEGRWHGPLLDACGIRADQLPRIIGSTEIAARLRPELAGRWHLPPGTPVAGGGGDNMCGGVGAGAVAAGDAYIGLGTSGIFFLANDRFVPALDRGMHTHRHAVAGLFAQHGVVLSAAAALDWVARLLAVDDIGALIAGLEPAPADPERTPVFTPYLVGERTPHDDATLTATFSGLTIGTERRELVQAVLEGVALAIADCADALASTGATLGTPRLIGGGARSRLWATLVASALDRSLHLPASAAIGPALGAARLARAAIGGPLIADAGPIAEVHPRAEWTEALAAKRPVFRAHVTGLGRRIIARQ